MALRNYSNVATPQPLSAGISDAAVTIPVPSTAGYPAAPFVLVFERGTANAEAALCTAKTANSFTVTRGFDGTTPVAHDANTIVEHTSIGLDFREANDHVNTAHLDPTTVNAKGDLLVATGDNVLDRIAVGTTQNQALVVHPAAGTGLAYKDIGLGAWTVWTPTWTATAGPAPSLGNGTVTGRYLRHGQTVHFQMYLGFGTSTYPGSGGAWLFGYPAGLYAREAGAFIQWANVAINKTDVCIVGTSILYAGGITALTPDNSPANLSCNWVQAGVPSTWGNGDYLRIWGTYETGAAVI